MDSESSKFMGAKLDMQRVLDDGDRSASTSPPIGRRVSAALYDPRELLDSVKRLR